MKHRFVSHVIVSSGAVAIAVALLLVLRPSKSIRPELAAPAGIPAAVRATLKTRMERHAVRMGDLVSYLLVLDYDGAARVAGSIYDEPALTASDADEISRYLPRQFFALNEELRDRTRRVVAAAAQRNPAKLADEFAALTKTCVLCHSAYLYESAALSQVPSPPPLSAPSPAPSPASLPVDAR